MKPLKTAEMRRSLAVAVALFFSFGFLGASNAVLIAFCKGYFHLTQLQAQLIETSFYGAYFYGSVAVYLLTYFFRWDLVQRLGYRGSMMLGVSISALGSWLLYWLLSGGSVQFYWVLMAFFVIALGFSLQQLVVNPLVLHLGEEQKGAFRLALAGGVNSLGGLLGPFILGHLLLGRSELFQGPQGLKYLSYLYLAFCVIFLIFLVLLRIIKMPPLQVRPVGEQRGRNTLMMLLFFSVLVPVIFFAEEAAQYLNISKLLLLWLLLGAVAGPLLYAYFYAPKRPHLWAVWQYRQVPLGMLAIFFYVGTEVTIQSNFNALFHGYSDTWLVRSIALYWGSLMIGRWIGTLHLFTLKGLKKTGIYSGVTLIGLAVVLSVFYVQQQGESAEQWIFLKEQWLFLSLYVLLGFLTSAVFYYQSPLFLLRALSLAGVVFLLTGLCLPLSYGQLLFIGSGFCCSVLWPCIFSLSLRSAGTEASAFLIMMILGGAVLPPLQGAMCDLQGFWVKGSYLLPALGFGYLFLYSFLVNRQNT